MYASRIQVVSTRIINDWHSLLEHQALLFTICFPGINTIPMLFPHLWAQKACSQTVIIGFAMLCWIELLTAITLFKEVHTSHQSALDSSAVNCNTWRRQAYSHILQTLVRAHEVCQNIWIQCYCTPTLCILIFGCVHWNIKPYLIINIITSSLHCE